jgi:hypothetical protein
MDAGVRTPQEYLGFGRATGRREVPVLQDLGRAGDVIRENKAGHRSNQAGRSTRRRSEAQAQAFGERAAVRAMVRCWAVTSEIADRCVRRRARSARAEVCVHCAEAAVVACGADAAHDLRRRAGVRAEGRPRCEASVGEG